MGVRPVGRWDLGRLGCRGDQDRGAHRRPDPWPRVRWRGQDRRHHLHVGALQPGKARHRARPQRGDRPEDRVPTRRDRRRVPHESAAARTEEAQDRPRRHSRRQPADHLRGRVGPGRARTRGREGRLRLDQLLVARLGLVVGHAERPRADRHARGRVRRFAQRHGVSGRNRRRAGAQGEDRGGRARRRVVARHRDVVDADGDRRRRGGGPRRDAEGRSHAGPESAREHLSNVGRPLDRALHAATRRVLGRLLHGDRSEGPDRRRALRHCAGARAARRRSVSPSSTRRSRPSRWRSGSRSWRRSPASGTW